MEALQEESRSAKTVLEEEDEFLHEAAQTSNEQVSFQRRSRGSRRRKWPSWSVQTSEGRRIAFFASSASSSKARSKSVPHSNWAATLLCLELEPSSDFLRSRAFREDLEKLGADRTLEEIFFRSEHSSLHNLTWSCILTPLLTI